MSIEVEFPAGTVDWGAFEQRMGAEQAGADADAARTAHATECRRLAEQARRDADAYIEAASGCAAFAETAALTLRAADQLGAGLRKAGVRDPDTWGNVATIQERALELAQAANAAADAYLTAAEQAAMRAWTLDDEADRA